MINCKNTGEVFKKYHDYLGSKHWKNKRLQVFSVKGNKCQSCGSDKDIHVHHITYKNIGDEKMKDLMVLCKDCHELTHKLIKQNNILKYNHLIKKKKKNKRVKKYKPQHSEKHFGLVEKNCIKDSPTDCIRNDIKQIEAKKKKSQFDLELLEYCKLVLKIRKVEL